MNKQIKNGLRNQALIFLVFVSFFLSPLWSLDPEKNMDGYLTDKWEMSQGLPSNRIRSIAQTPDGFLWIATFKGLVRYDGIKFSSAPFPRLDTNNSQKHIVPDTVFLDRTGILWIGSPIGLTSYDYKTGQIQSFPFTGENGMSRDLIRRINEDTKGNLWIGFFNNDLKRFFKGQYATFGEGQGLSGKKINTIIEDHKGNLLFGARESGVFVYKDDTFSKYPVKELESAQVISMQEDWKGNLWVGTVKGLFEITGQGTNKYTTSDGLMDNFISYILEDTERNLWIGTVKGLNRLNRKENEKVHVEGFPQSFVVSWIFEDREKNIWVGTDNDGLIRLRDARFSSYKPLEAYPGEIPSALFEDRGKDTWVGTVGGKLFRCRGLNIIERFEPPDLTNIGIAAMAEDFEGNLWLGTIDKGVFQRKKGKFKQYKRETTENKLCDNTVTSIYCDSRNNLWLSTLTGVSIIYALDNKNVFESFTSGEGLSGKAVSIILEDKNQDIWIGADQGITVLKGGKTGKENIDHYLDGIPVSCIYEDPKEPGVYWVSTDGAGLNRLTIKNRSLVSRTAYTTAEGMTSNIIFQFLEDNEGWFWLMSDSGVLRVNKNELNRFAGKESDNFFCTSFGTTDGMKSTVAGNKFSRNSVLKTGSNEIWFLTDKGISIVNPGKIRINKAPPPVAIEAVYINRQPIPLERSKKTCTARGAVDFSVEFTAPTFLSPEKMKFKYRLEGFEKDWLLIRPGNERAAHYKNLTPGAYTFKVIACNADGVWNETGDSITVTIKPYFHQTVFFKMILFLLMAILVAAIFYLYKKQRSKKNLAEEKKKYQGSQLDSRLADECAAKLTHLMEKEKVYRDMDISLQTLAEKISTTPHILSQVLNEKLNRSFPDYINSYRVEEARKIFESARGAEKKNSAVADEVGFNNLGVFYKAFKKFTGMTPNAYKKIQKQRSTDYTD
jgi:ligand-binding sensor domain-containing protein/AraC-like DNA-binding protein